MNKKFLYLTVRQRLEKELISAGKPGDYLPPLSDLCKRFSASTITVNRALRDLAADGVVKRIKHCGTQILRTPSAREADPLQALHKKHCIKVLSVHPQRWLIMQIIEQKLVDFCKFNTKYELQCEYAVREEQLERIQLKDYDFIIADSSQVKLMMHKADIRNQLLPLDKLSGFYFDLDEFSPAAINMGMNKNRRLYGVPLITGPNLQMINDLSEFSDELVQLSPYWSTWLSQLRKLQRNGQPMLNMPLDWRYMEPVFRMHNIDVFDPDVQYCQLNTPEVRNLLEEMVYFFHHEKLRILPDTRGEQNKEFLYSALKKSRTPIKISSLIFFRPGGDYVNFRIKPLPQARRKAAWLFWEGILVGKNCDRTLAADLLNYLQSAAVQSKLLGCTGLPARLDMQKLILAGCEPDLPGITETFTQSMEFADNPCAVSYPVLQLLNECFRNILCGQEPVKRSLSTTVQNINSLLHEQ